jgi:small-conductance mechanosensitive channel
MLFLNSSLFGKNFNNLTRNNSYELTIVTVGVAYGTEIQRVREVLVAERVAYFDRAKEAIYDALTAAGITIAFPQCDVHLIQEE